jgi:hypothetical protein
MHSVSGVQEHWVRLLRTELAPGEVRCVKVEPGHFVVVVAAARGTGNTPAADYHALESCLGSLDGTRAIYLNSRSGLALDGNSNLRSWAGDCAAEVESGAKRAFAVVQMEIFRERIREELVGQGWAAASYGEDLKASAGGFSELINVPREAVRMVLSRGDFAAAARSIGEKTGRRLAHDGEFFAAFKSRFESFFPATLDHFFVAYPEASCVAVGWDYWQLAERPVEEAEAVFEEGMKEIELLLRTSREDRPAGLPVGACGRINQGN